MAGTFVNVAIIGSRTLWKKDSRFGINLENGKVEQNSRLSL